MADHVELLSGSNLPHHEKQSLIRRLYGRVSGYGFSKAKAHAIEGAHAVRQTGESLIAGAALGVVHAEYGLDYKGKAPIDLGVGVAGSLLAVVAAHETSTDMRNIAASGFTTFAFRKAYEITAEKKLAKGQQPVGQFLKGGATVVNAPAVLPAAGTAAAQPAGEFGEDPVVAAARLL